MDIKGEKEKREEVQIHEGKLYTEKIEREEEHGENTRRQCECHHVNIQEERKRGQMLVDTTLLGLVSCHVKGNEIWEILDTGSTKKLDDNKSNKYAETSTIEINVQSAKGNFEHMKNGLQHLHLCQKWKKGEI